MLDALVDTLLYEGYALYPYTPGATKNATPTPFGIVYPPVYAAGSGATFDHLQIECVCRRRLGARRGALPPGERGRATRARRAASTCPARSGRARASTSTGCRGTRLAPLAGGRMTIRVENHTEVPAGLDRGEALRHSLLSTHVVGRVAGGRFISPLEATGCENVNSWPVLATQEDDAVLGAAIMLPDHPQIAPESKRQPVRLDRDRGGAADPRARAVGRGARGGGLAGPGGAADARARGEDDPAGADGPARARDGRRPARGRAGGRGRRRAVPARRHGRAAPRGQRDAAGPPRRGPARRRSSASTTTTTAPSTWR